MLHRCHDKTLEHLKSMVRVLSKATQNTPIPKADWIVLKESIDFMSLQVKRHEEDEEKSLFPMLGSSHKLLIEKLKKEHRSQQKTLTQLQFSLKAIAQNKAQPNLALDSAAELLHMYTHHIDYENKHLLPLVDDLSIERNSQLKKEMRSRRQE